jgi:hypothetical protein
MVYQEYEKSSSTAESTDFIPCLIGPCYHVVDGVSCSEESYVKEYFDGASLENTVFPSLKSGILIDPDSMYVHIAGDPKALYKKDKSVKALIYNGAVITFDDLDTTEIIIGDDVVLKNASTSVVLHTARVVEVSYSNKTATMNVAYTGSLTGSFTIDVYRHVDSFILRKNGTGVNTVVSTTNPNNSVIYSCNLFTINVSSNVFTIGEIYVKLNGTFCKLINFKIYVGYKAREIAKNKLAVIQDVVENTSYLGEATIENPLSLAVSVVLANMAKTPVKVFATVDDTLSSWEEAISALSLDSNVYTIIPLTQDVSVLTLFKNHCVEMSNYLKSQPRICLGSGLVDTFNNDGEKIVKTSGTCTLQKDINNILNTLVAGANDGFLDKGVASSDEIVLYDLSGLQYIFNVNKVLSNNIVTTAEYRPFSIVKDAVTLTKQCLPPEYDGFGTSGVEELDSTSAFIQVGIDDTSTFDSYVMLDPVGIPKDTTISTAYLQLSLYASVHTETKVKIYGVLPSNTLEYPSSLSELNALHLTTSSVTWTVPSGGVAYNTLSSADIKTIINEIVASPGYDVTTSNLLFVLKNDGTNEVGDVVKFCSSSYLGGAYAAKVVVTHTPIVFTTDTVYQYTIIHKLSHTDLANKYKDLSTSLATSTRANMINIWPSKCEVTGFTGVTLPGYYLSAAIGGLIGQLPSQQSLTRQSVAGIEKLIGVDGFTIYDLDLIASGGTCILTQNYGATPMVRHQLTTNTDTIEFRELSFVKNFDYVSIILRSALDNFIGKYNITQKNLLLLGTVIRANLDNMKLNNQPVIGSAIIDYNIVSITQSNDQRDNVEIVVNVLFPYVMNYIGLHIVSQ